MPLHVHRPIGEFLEYAGGSASFPMRAVYQYVALRPRGAAHSGIITRSNATLRTTSATTIFNAGTKDNVMPSRATAIINFRLLPGDTIASVTEHVRKVINDPRLRMQPMAGESPS